MGESSQKQFTASVRRGWFSEVQQALVAWRKSE
jgi:hypothetical protein